MIIATNGKGKNYEEYKKKEESASHDALSHPLLIIILYKFHPKTESVIIA